MPSAVTAVLPNLAKVSFTQMQQHAGTRTEHAVIMGYLDQWAQQAARLWRTLVACPRVVARQHLRELVHSYALCLRRLPCHRAERSMQATSAMFFNSFLVSEWRPE